jgi:alpha-galactosidase/6-phospho-beta-glucosidase family protein
MAPTITIVGGGSYHWAPIILSDIAATPELSGARVVLQDVNPAHLGLVQRWSEVMLAQTGAHLTVESVLDLTEAVRDASAVILCISTGGLEAMRHDLEIPERHGVVQSVGDTVGPGGLARALRNVPVVVEIAKTIERVAPRAWLLSLTNPMTTLCRAINRTTSLRTIGLCHELFGTLRMLSRLFEVPESELHYRVAGVNHLIWLLDLTVDGRDAFPRLREIARSGEITRVQTPVGNRRPTTDNYRLKLALFEAFGALPAAGDRHLAEFFPYFLTEATGYGAAYEIALTSIEDREGWQRDYRANVEAQIAGQRPIPRDRSREEIASIIAAIHAGEPSINVMNLPNEGQISNLPGDAVVETLGAIDGTHARGLSVGELPAAVQGVLHRHVINQELTVEAALTGDRKLALQALIADPLVRDFQSAPKLLDEMLAANRALLPRFA